MWCRDLWGALGKNITFPRVLLEEGLLSPKTKDPVGARRGLLSAGDRGASRGNLTFAAFSGATPYIPCTVQAWDSFSGKEAFT